MAAKFSKFDYKELEKMFVYLEANSDVRKKYLQNSQFLDKPALGIENLSPFQAEIFRRCKDSNVINSFIGRQIGKSAGGSATIIDTIGDLKKGDGIVLVGLKQNSLAKIWYETGITEVLLGEGNYVHNSSDLPINYVYLNATTFPKVGNWLVEIVTEAEEYQARMIEKYPDLDMNKIDERYPIEFVKLLKEGVIVYSEDGTPYVRFYRNRIGFSNSNQGMVQAIAYNGVIINHLGGDTDKKDKDVRGTRISAAFCEELGEMEGSFKSGILPAILSKGGFLYAVGTPPKNGKKNENISDAMDWTKDYIPERIAGLEIYTKVTPENKQIVNEDGTLTEKQYTVKTVTIIGRLESVFPYSFGGHNNYNKLQNQRTIPKNTDSNYNKNVPKRAIVERDNYDKIKFITELLPKVVVDNYGNSLVIDIETKLPSLKIIHSPIAKDYPRGRIGDLSIAQYETEYQMNFNASEILCIETLDPETHYIDDERVVGKLEGWEIITGVDKGVGNSINDSKGNRRSDTSFVRIAMKYIPEVGKNQYVVMTADMLEGEEELDTTYFVQKLADCNQSGEFIVADQDIFKCRDRKLINGKAVGIPYIQEKIYQARLEGINIFNKEIPTLMHPRLDVLVPNQSLVPNISKGRDIERVGFLNKLFSNKNLDYIDFKYSHLSEAPLDYIPPQIMITKNAAKILIKALESVIYETKPFGKSEMKCDNDDVLDAFTYAISYSEREDGMKPLESRWKVMENFYNRFHFAQNKIEAQQDREVSDVQNFLRMLK